MCNCVKIMNEKLFTLNGRILQGFDLTNGVLTLLPAPLVCVGKIEPHKNAPPSIIALFCPFCGAEYERPAASPSQSEGKMS